MTASQAFSVNSFWLMRLPPPEPPGGGLDPPAARVTWRPLRQTMQGLMS